MDTLSVLFWDSFKSMFVFSLGVETSWFAAVEFGTYNLYVITAVSLLGAMVGSLLTMSIGYIAGHNRRIIADLDEDLFERLSVNFSRYGIFIFFFQMMPFSKLFLLFAAMFVVPWRRLLLFVFLGRIVYYIYYLSLDKVIFG